MKSIASMFISFDKHAFFHALVTSVYYTKQSNIKLKYPTHNNASQKITPFQKITIILLLKKLLPLEHYL